MGEPVRLAFLEMRERGGKTKAIPIEGRDGATLQGNVRNMLMDRITNLCSKMAGKTLFLLCFDRKLINNNMKPNWKKPYHVDG